MRMIIILVQKTRRVFMVKIINLAYFIPHSRSSLIRDQLFSLTAGIDMHMGIILIND